MKTFIIPMFLLAASAVQAETVAAPAGPAVTAPTWTGAWVGFGVGHGSSAYDIHTRFFDPVTTNSYFWNDLPDIGGGGALLSAEAGYDWQLSPDWVAGVAVDDSAAWIDTQGGFGVGAGALVDTSLAYRMKARNLATGALRLGYLATPNTMFYGLVGASHGDFEGEYAYTVNGIPGGGNRSFGLAGSTVGVGVETRLSAHSSFKVEYRRTEFGYSSLADVPINDSLSYRAKAGAQVESFRAVIAYRF